MALTPSQERVVRLILAMGNPDLHLAGGAALIVHDITDRTTKDLDTFLSQGGDTFKVADDIRTVLEGSGMEVSDVSHTDTDILRKFTVTLKNGDRVSVDIGRDPRILPGEVTRVGRAVSRLELGANKLVSLYGDPSRARDVDDIAHALKHFSMDELLEVADKKESEPLDRGMLAYAFYQASRLKDKEYPAESDAEGIKKFAHDVALHFRDGDPLPKSPYTEVTGDNTVRYPVESGRCGALRKRGGLCRRRVSDKGCPYH